MAQEGLNIGPLLVFSTVFGFDGAIISLLISKRMATWSTGAQAIDGRGSTQRWLIETVQRLAQRAGIGMPEVAIYEGEANAFATGAFKNSALVAASGLLQSMSQEEVETVLGHEVAQCRERRHGDIDVDSGRAEYLRHLPGAHRRHDRRAHRVPYRARHGSGLLHHGLRVRDRVCDPRPDHRRVGSRASASSAPIAARPNTSAPRGR
jgi:hypothetical protein